MAAVRDVRPTKAPAPASSSLADLETDEPIICNVCLSVYDEGSRCPLTLTCRHSFCASCIADSLMTPEDRTKVFCPLCKTKTILGANGIAGLPVNERSLEFVRSLERRKQMEEQGRMMESGFDPSGVQSSYPSVPPQVAYPVWAAKTGEPGQPKGILKKKVNSREQRIVRVSTQTVGQQQQQPVLSNGAAMKSSNGAIASPVCSQCEAERAADAKKKKNQAVEASVTEQHAVIVKSVDRLHPPPNSFSSFSDVQPLPATMMETSGQDQRHLTSGNNDDDDIEGERGMEEAEEAASIAYPFLTDLSSSGDPHMESADILSRSRDSSDIPGFLRPVSVNGGGDPTSIVPDTTPGPIRGKIDGSTSSGPIPPNGRIYPVSALLYMASAEGIPRDQIGSSGPEGGVTSPAEQDDVIAPLTESQRVLPPGAKYVGRFGKYSDRRQPGSFGAPQRIACSTDGARLAVTDLSGSGGVVHMFTSMGEFIVTFPVPQTTGGVCFFSDGNLAVTTVRGLQVHAPNGTQKKTIPIGGVFAVAAFTRQTGFVAATRNRISVCRSLVGSVVHSINGKRHPGLLQKQIPFEEITDVAVGPRDELCILESKVVLVMNEEGVLATVIRPDVVETVCGPLGRAVAVAVCPDDGSIVVADAGHRRVLLFGPDGQFIRCLANTDDSAGCRTAAGWNVSGVAVTRSRRMFVVLSAKQMAEVRVYAISTTLPVQTPPQPVQPPQS